MPFTPLYADDHRIGQDHRRHSSGGTGAPCQEIRLMHFTAEQIALARQMRDHGLPWDPAVGHYVHDETGLIEIPSPFQQHVYFILDMKHFLRRAGTVDALKARMLWLPQWHQARKIARDLGIPDAVLTRQLANGQAFESDAELNTLYRLIIEALQSGRASRSTPGPSAGAD
jgi:hypothetical protein